METLYNVIWGSAKIFLSQRQKKALHQAISSLSEDQQKVLFLYYTKQLPIKEIALQLHCSVTTTYNKLNHVLFTLKNQFNPTAFEKAYRILYPETGKPVAL